MAVLMGAGLVVTLLVLRQKTAPRPAAPVYRTARVAVRPILGFLKTTGWIEPDSKVRIGSLVTGQVTAVKVSVGDRVTGGQVLARLDDREQRASLAGGDAQVALAELRATKAEARLRETLRGLKHGGYPLDDPPIEELLDGPAGDAQLDAIDAAVHVQKQDADLALLRHRLGRRVIRAPVAGVITSRSVEAGETVATSPPGPPLFVLTPDHQPLRVRAEVDETYVARIEAVPAWATVTAVPDRAFVAEVERISPVPGANRSPVRYSVVFSLAVPDHELPVDMSVAVRAGMSVVVDLPMSTPRGALSVPLAAVDFTANAPAGVVPGTPIVWMLERDGQPTPVPVELGVADKDFVEIRSGRLSEGQTIALMPKTR